ncbi:TVP38/TMEM64 family protein [Marinococcus luteus]|uniref:TVP38/TMEM64 family protein n=1 Tax=Marinococcus luteus TaxID=1122204 RepID=UPI002ACC6D66|nr:TVP38/TMEM64 family protein [Marinococcus luteus]MDZ5782640.1 TVP38/TMEM64 family protein [Marinococcus luteus]
MKTKLKHYALRLTITVSAAILILLLSRFYLHLNPEDVKGWMESIGFFGPVVVLLLFAVRPYLLVPLPIFAVAVGFFFGHWLGALLIFLGAVLGASVSFFTKRRKAGDLNLDEKNMEELDKIKEELEDHGFKFLLMLRLIPVLHYDLLTSLSARMDVGWGQYLGATALGTIPRAVLLGFFGSSILSFDPMKMIILGVLAVVIAVLGYVLKRRVEDEFDTEELKEETKQLEPPV